MKKEAEELMDQLLFYIDEFNTAVVQSIVEDWLRRVVKKRTQAHENLIRRAWYIRGLLSANLPAWRKREMIKRRLKAELKENTK